MATLFVVAFLAGVFLAGAFLAAEPVEVATGFFAEVFVAGELFAGVLRAVVFWAVFWTVFRAVLWAVFFFGSPDAEALFLAAAVRWGADFFRADVAMVSYPLPSSETGADWSQDSRSRAHHVPA
ncbi:hypothetical protein [Kribbella shirazensis]|uniref:hypothetical protein n=1 Tax=Kribbella shirazensis TaxID=1105143 RepID=UPI00192E0C5F|nr:hypothetical protein [Kribbella shirazensis]